MTSSFTVFLPLRYSYIIKHNDMNVRNYRVYIEDQEALRRSSSERRRSSILAIDTEFLREKTYYARLCLIQFATDDEVAVVDPFCIEDLHVLALFSRMPAS